jgi:hypothetical protein
MHVSVWLSVRRLRQRKTRPRCTGRSRGSWGRRRPQWEDGCLSRWSMCSRCLRPSPAACGNRPGEANRSCPGRAGLSRGRRRLPVLSSGKMLDVLLIFSYILKRLYLSLLRVGLLKEATTAPFCNYLQKRGFISRPLDRRSSDRRICSEDPPPPLLCPSPGLKTGRGSPRFRSDGRGPLRSTVNSP